MNGSIRFFCVFLTVCTISPPAAEAETVTTTWGGDAGIVYETGFMHMLMQRRDGVSLFNMELIENDSPGFSAPGASTARVRSGLLRTHTP